MEDDQQFCLRWNNHQNTLISNFDKLLENGTLVDCTLAAEGQFLKAHKVVLSACSPYFANLLKEQYDKHPIFILKDVKYQELRAMMDYMYRGEVNISQDQLAALLKAAESLQIKGLSDRPQRSTDQHPNINVPGRMQHPHGGGYTLEQTKRPRLGPVIDTPDMREGSSSPTSRKRKKLRRRSIENVLDNHEHSNSSAHSTQPINTSTPSITSGTAAIVATSQQQQQQSQQSLQQSSVSQQQQQQQGNIVGTKKTENVSNIKQTAGSSDDVLLAEQDNQIEQDKQIKKDQNKQQRKSGHDKDELLIEPKNEYEEVNEPIEDLTEDPEELMDEEDLDNQAGPSHHGGEGSSQGFPQWPADRSQDEFIMTAQDQGQQRDPQGNSIWTLVEALPTSTSIVSPQTTHTVLLQIPASVAASAGLQNNIQLQTLIPAVTASTTGTTLTTQSIKSDKEIKTNYTVQEIHTIEAIEEISSHQLHELQTHEQQQLQQQQQQRQPHQHQSDPLQLPQHSMKSHTATTSTTTQLTDDDAMYEDIPHLEQESVMSDEYNKETKTVQTSSHQSQRPHHQPHKSITTKGKIVITNPKTTAVKQFKIPAAPLHVQHQRQSHQGQQTQQHHHQTQSQQFPTNQKIKYEKSDIKSSTKEITITSISSGVKIKSELPFVCDQCGKPYKIKGSLKRHKIYECGVVPSLQCNYCTHRSKYKSDLKKHVLQKHPDVYEGIE